MAGVTWEPRAGTASSEFQIAVCDGGGHYTCGPLGSGVLGVRPSEAESEARPGLASAPSDLPI